MRKFSILFFLVTVTLLTKGSTIIKCENIGYAGKKLQFFRFSDPISKDTEIVFSLNFDAAGKCQATINKLVSDYVFCDFGIYRGMFFLEPNETVELLLPPFRGKSFADKKNPYFSPVEFWIKTKNSSQITNHISNFTKLFNQLIDKHFNELYFRRSEAIYDTIANTLEKEFGAIQSEDFLFHKKMKLKMVEVEAFREKPEQFASLFSSIDPRFWLNKSFIDLFEKAFANQLSFEAKSVKGAELRSAVNRANISYLRDFVKGKYSVSGEITDLVLLKLLHDAFYSGDFSKSAIQKMAGYSIFTTNSNEIIRQAAVHISANFSHLQKGTLAPVICLENLEGTRVCTDEDKQKFKYIVFADTEMMVCREHLKYLKPIKSRFRKYLDIYIVLRETEETAIKKFLTDNEIVGVKLIDKNSIYISKYKVKSFPQCFLLNEKHLVQFKEAKAPLDGFEQQFGKFLQNELFMRQRNRAK